MDRDARDPGRQGGGVEVTGVPDGGLCPGESAAAALLNRVDISALAMSHAPGMRPAMHVGVVWEVNLVAPVFMYEYAARTDPDLIVQGVHRAFWPIGSISVGGDGIVASTRGREDSVR